MPLKHRKGKDTFIALQDWLDQQSVAERLAAHILSFEGFTSIDPIHPLGGRDGLKDVVCVRDDLKWIGAVYFARRKKTFSSIRKKFLGDLKGVEANGANGIVFVTNQELTDAERKKIKVLTTFKVEIYHLERIAQILDEPRLYGIRLEFLNIEMTKEEQVAFFAELSQSFEDFQRRLIQAFEKAQNSAQPSLEVQRLKEQLQTFFENRNNPLYYGIRLPWERQEVTIDQVEQLLQKIVKLAESLPTAVSYLDQFKDSISEFKPLSEIEKLEQTIQALSPTLLHMGREPGLPETVEHAKKVLGEYNQLLYSILTKQHEIHKNHDQIKSHVIDLNRLTR